MFFRQVFDPTLAQYAYLIGCQRTGEAIVVDPERDIDRYLDIAREEGLRIVAAAETHIHADFLSGARELAERHGVRVYLSDEGDDDWKYEWATASSGDVQLVRDGDVFKVGNIRFRVMHTPGHTPEHVAFLVTDLGGGADEPMGIASGDFVFVGDVGRPDLLETAAGVQGAREPSARALYASGKRFLTLDDHLQVWPGHGAGSACGKALGAVPMSTVGYERRFNAALSYSDEDAFVGAILDGQPDPPAYFARMKALNKQGPPLLEALPGPRQTPLDEAVARAARGVVVVDTRRDRAAFMAAHVPGSIHAPLGVSFAMIVGSYVDPDAELHLIAEPHEVDGAVRTLVRIGYDRTTAYTAIADLEGASGLEQTPRTTFPELPADVDTSTHTVLDVRSADEHAGPHVPGAINIPHTRLGLRLDEVPRDKPVLAYCRSGNRAASATSLLAREGYDVTHVDGMIDAWAGHTGKPVAAGN